MKRLADLIYGVKSAKRKYLQSNPDEVILAADGSKGIKTKGDKDLERGMDWITSQRAVILLTDKRIKSGSWDILLEEVETAQLLKVDSLFGAGQVLKIGTRDKINYQFGMQANPDWTSQTMLPVTLQNGHLKTSVFSWLVRMFLVGYIAYRLLQYFDIV